MYTYGFMTVSPITNKLRAIIYDSGNRLWVQCVNLGFQPVGTFTEKQEIYCVWSVKWKYVKHQGRKTSNCSVHTDTYAAVITVGVGCLHDTDNLCVVAGVGRCGPAYTKSIKPYCGILTCYKYIIICLSLCVKYNPSRLLWNYNYNQATYTMHVIVYNISAALHNNSSKELQFNIGH